MNPWKTTISFMLIIALAGCTSTAKMTALDRSLVRKNLTHLSSGGVQIDMDGSFLLNPTAAVETFHTVAEKAMSGRPYRYTYAVDKKQMTRQVPAATPSSTGSGSSGSNYIPLYVPSPAGGGGMGSGEAAIILGSLALILVIISLAKKDDSAPAASTAPLDSQADNQPAGSGSATPREQVTTTRTLKVSGTAERIDSVSLDRTRLVEVIVPDAPPVIGRLKSGVAQKVGEEIRRGFEGLGCQVLLTDRPQKSGYTVRTTVLRAQGNLLQYSNLTLEISLQDQRTGRELTRWVVQASEKPFDLKSQNERMYGDGIATSILQKPLKTQLSRYLR